MKTECKYQDEEFHIKECPHCGQKLEERSMMVHLRGKEPYLHIRYYHQEAKMG